MNSRTNKNLGGLTKNDLEIIVSIFEKENSIDEAVLFGSRAKGNFQLASDVDIALKGTLLNFRIISHISYLLNEETNLPYKFDILNYESINKDLIDHIDRVGIVIYKKIFSTA
jgi:predicted nucleotidyltransferase